jgi:hypothetical protein
MASASDSNVSMGPMGPWYHNFLKGTPPTPSKTIVDFKKAGLSEYDGLYAVVLDGILSPEECQKLVQLAEDSAMDGTDGNQVVWKRAMVNVGNGMQVMAEDTRKCGRIIFDSQDVVNALWGRIKDLVPELREIVNQPDVTGEGPVKRKEVWKMTRLNEKMRFLKYTAGEYFRRRLFLTCVSSA